MSTSLENISIPWDIAGKRRVPSPSSTLLLRTSEAIDEERQYFVVDVFKALEQSAMGDADQFTALKGKLVTLFFQNLVHVVELLNLSNGMTGKGDLKVCGSSIFSKRFLCRFVESRRTVFTVSKLC